MANTVEPDKEGLYGVCVFGAESTADSELKKLFGQFGAIENFRRSNNLVFIRYKTRGEAVNCLDSMAENKSYRVKPARKKTNNEYNSPRDSTDNSRNSNWKNSGSGDGSDSTHRRSGSNYNHRRGGSDYNHRRSGDNGDSYDSSPSRPMPKLVPVLPPAAGKKKIAKDVLIGNLPTGMNQHSVYELCSCAKIAPLHVEMRIINRPPFPVISYAQVFVKTDEDVKIIVEALNKLVINEHQLVVGSKDEFAEEGKKFFT